MGGIIPPVPTFFDTNDALDLATLRQHIAWLATYPLGGILALGSNGEAMHLSDDERVAAIAAARAAISETGRDDLLLLAGTADLSTRGTIARCRAAAAAGADIAVVLPPFAFPTQMTPAALRAHFLAVADASPVPIAIYNMPANTAGINLSAELIVDLARHPNIVGVKDSSGQVEKLAQIVAGARSDFAALAGSGGFLLPALSVGACGAVAAVANIAPWALVALQDAWERNDLTSAQMIQAHVIPLNALVTARFGVAGLKAALELARGYGGAPRSPLLPLDDVSCDLIAAELEKLRASLPER
jgi:4-hydroxy-2-oxoglutarate aldolase